jgi:hypothetical protein
MLEQTSTLVGIASALVVVLGAVIGWLRWVRPRARRAASRVGAALDTIAGREAIVDNITGRELAPALPSIGERMDTMERTVSMLAQQQAHQAVQDREIAALTGRVENVENDVQQLKDGTIERIAAKAESVAAWKAVEAVAKQTDPIDGAPELD